MRTLGQALAVRGEQRSMPNVGGVGWSDPSAIPPNSSFSRQLAGVVVNEMSALQITAVMACLRLISGVIGGFPMETFQKGSGGLTRIDDPLLVTDPFDGVEAGEGIEGSVIAMMTSGNAYNQIVDRDKRGTPTLLEPLPPHLVECRRQAGLVTYKVNRRPVPAEDMLHLRWFTLPGACVGISPIEYAAQSLGIALAADEYGARFFSQGATLSGILSKDGPLSDTQARRIAQQFMTHHSGLGQSHLPLVLDGGMKFQPVSVPPEQAQFLATRGYAVTDIAMLYGVPPHLLGAVDRSTSWGKGIQDQKMDFVTFTLGRYMRRFEAAWSRCLPPGQVAKFNIDGLLRANSLDRFSGYMMLRTMAGITINEIRVKEDMPVIDDPRADDPFAPLNSSPQGAVTGAEGGTGQGDEGNNNPDDPDSVGPN